MKNHTASYFSSFIVPIIIFLFTTLPANGQQGNYFIAGDNTGVIYHDIEPDFTLVIPPANGWIYTIDINLDSINDFAIEVDYSSGISHDVSDIAVSSYGSNKVALGYVTPFIDFEGDTVSMISMGKGLYQGDIIDSNIVFSSGLIHLKSDWWYIGAAFYASWIPGDYIPVCLVEDGNPNCIYGWIKVSDVSMSHITIESFAANIPTITSINPAIKRKISIQPNPANKGNITITLEGMYKNLHLACLNTFGQEVHSEDVHGNETVINVADWNAGIYIVMVYSSGKPVGRAKFMVR